jgi:DNA repair exonuclease SbcCD ATPase subunit
MNPTDLARRWKPYRNAVERADKAAKALRAAREELDRLRSELGPAESEDQLALGRALLDGKAEPPSQVAQIQEEIQAQERRVSALERALAEATGQIAGVIAEHKSSWRREALTEISKAGTRYEAALSELADARENLSSAVGLNEWVASGGAAAGEPANERLAGDGSLGFSQVLAALRADREQLISFDSLERETPVRVALERVQRAGSWGR